MIRTQCDKFREKDAKSLQEELDSDKKILEGCKIKFSYPIFATSAEKGLDFMDNGKLRELLINPSKFKTLL